MALTGLRNIIGQHDLDEILQERNKINTLLGDNISGSTAAWGLEVQRFEMKDVELPQAMQQVMAMQAEAIREKRARIIKAEAELEASVKLSAAAAQITANPAALELRPAGPAPRPWKALWPRWAQQQERRAGPLRVAARAREFVR